MIIGNQIVLVDGCIKAEIQTVNDFFFDFITVASCCGHGKFHKTIFVTKKGKFSKNQVCEVFSGLKIIPVKKKYWGYYVKDRKTKLYYNPEIEAYYDQL